MKSKKVLMTVLSASMIIPMMASNVYASERVLTDHNTYIEDGQEFNLDGTPYVRAEEQPVVEVTEPVVEQPVEVTESDPTEVVEDDSTKAEDPSKSEDKEVDESKTKKKNESEKKEEPSIDPSAPSETTKEQTEPKVDEPKTKGDKSKSEDKHADKKLKVKEEVFVPSLTITFYGNNGYKLDNLDRELKEVITRNYDRFVLKDNPFGIGECTWYAWSRFYQVYGMDSGARGNGKENAREIVEKHSDLFELSNTPATGAIYSQGYNTLYPEYGHVGFVEAYDGEYLWISEGNLHINESAGYIWVHKVKLNDFMTQYPDTVFAIPKKEKVKDKKSDIHKAIQMLNKDERWQDK